MVLCVVFGRWQEGRDVFDLRTDVDPRNCRCWVIFKKTQSTGGQAASVGDVDGRYFRSGTFTLIWGRERKLEER